MGRVCDALTAKTVPPALAAVLGTAVSAELRKVAEAFAELQDQRHDADYNLGQKFSKSEAEEIADLAADAMETWASVSPAVAGPFLLLLLIGEPKPR
jgi:hypothetical protein